ncbi:hypothetical protein Tco_0023777, partial [Tanacetum coccineum]
LWQLTGVPCVHAVAAYMHLSRDLDEGVSHWQIKCCNCQGVGHNKSSCDREAVPKPPIVKRLMGRIGEEDLQPASARGGRGSRGGGRGSIVVGIGDMGGGSGDMGGGGADMGGRGDMGGGMRGGRGTRGGGRGTRGGGRGTRGGGRGRRGGDRGTKSGGRGTRGGGRGRALQVSVLMIY